MICSKLISKDPGPNYHSIADFRKINASALQNLFKLFVLFLKEAGLIGGNVIAVDGTKIRGNNSKDASPLLHIQK
ncbi:MAG: hypothetical protein M9958_11830 [Chitinophagales bacterium]|nr:hypothetical protein [Chitinophagales bacterium]